MYTVEVRVRCLMRHRVVEFSKRFEMPFTPYEGLPIEESAGPLHSTTYTLEEVRWCVDDGGRFIGQAEDDATAADVFSDDYTGLVEDYTVRGWREYRRGGLRVMGLVRQSRDRV
jgi:hypothetical protein